MQRVARETHTEPNMSSWCCTMNGTSNNALCYDLRSKWAVKVDIWVVRANMSGRVDERVGQSWLKAFMNDCLLARGITMAQKKTGRRFIANYMTNFDIDVIISNIKLTMRKIFHLTSLTSLYAISKLEELGRSAWSQFVVFHQIYVASLVFTILSKNTCLM